MAKQVIGVGTVANDNTGDFLRPAMIKINENFSELYDFNDTFAAVAFTGDYSDLNNVPAGASFDGSYNSLTDTPTLGTASAEDIEFFALAAQGIIAGGSTGQALIKASNSDFDLEWGDAGSITEIVEDTSPQLGGNLDLNGFDIVGKVIGTDVQAYSAVLAATTASFLLADETKLDALPTNATLQAALDLKANAADYVAKSLFDANTIIYATSDNTPAALTVAEETIVGRRTGGEITDVPISELLVALGETFGTDGVLVVEDGVITVEDGTPISYATLDEYLDGASTSLLVPVNTARFVQIQQDKDYSATVTLLWDGSRIVDGDLADSDSHNIIIDDVSGNIAIAFNSINPDMVGMPWRVRLINNGSGSRTVTMSTANGITADMSGITIPSIATGSGKSVELQGTIISTTHVRLDRAFSWDGSVSAIVGGGGGGGGDVTLDGVQTLTNKTLTAPVINAGTIGTSLVPTTDDGAALGDTSHGFADLFLAEGGVINWDNGDVTITQTNNVIAIAGITTLTSSGTITPASNDGAALGTTALQFSDLFLAEGAVINFDNGDITITQTGDALAIAGNTTLTSAGAINPASNDGAALGSTTAQWSDLFLAEGAVINFDNGDATITQTGNDITIGGISTFGVGTSTAVTLGTIELGHASQNTLSASSGVLSIEGLPIGPNIVTNSLSAAKTFALTEMNQAWYHPSADTSARTWTIDSNTNAAAPVGSFLTFINDTSGGVITIAITSDTLVWSPAGTTGSRQLAANGIATAVKMTSTRWMISGSGLT